MTASDISAITKPWDVQKQVITFSSLFLFIYNHGEDLHGEKDK